MNGPWNNEEDLLECILYWQKKALEADDYIEVLIEELLQSCKNEKYWHQQLLDKQKELECLKVLR